MEQWMIFAGIGQLLLAMASLAIPIVLEWRKKTRMLDPLTRQVFWTYAGYIWAFNLSFGLLSTFFSSLLLDASSLAIVVCGFISLYWGVRLAIQFTSFGKHAPTGMRFKIAEALLILLFLFLTWVYGTVVFAGLNHVCL